jgi:UDP-N-acetylmuramate dehydrogenase
MNEFLDFLKELGVVYTVESPISQFSTMKVGGVADVIVVAKSETDLVVVAQKAHDLGVAYYVVGGLSNTVFSDKPFHGVLILSQLEKFEIQENGEVILGAGVTTAIAASKISNAGLQGFEWAAGVPGKIGGAIVGNAGALGGEMKDSCVSVRVYDVDVREFRVLSVEECEFEYRESRFKREPTLIILDATFYFKAGDIAVSRELITKALQYRNTTQPKGVVSCGCMFKNYEVSEDEVDVLRAAGVKEEFLEKRLVPAGYLIQECGLKGFRMGQAQVSEIHGNFLVNLGGASVDELRDLVDFVREKVRAQFGVELHEEVRYIGSRD